MAREAVRGLVFTVLVHSRGGSIGRNGEHRPQPYDFWAVLPVSCRAFWGSRSLLSPSPRAAQR